MRVPSYKMIISQQKPFQAEARKQAAEQQRKELAERKAAEVRRTAMKGSAFQVRV